MKYAFDPETGEHLGWIEDARAVDLHRDAVSWAELEAALPPIPDRPMP